MEGEGRWVEGLSGEGFRGGGRFRGAGRGCGDGGGWEKREGRGFPPAPRRISAEPRFRSGDYSLAVTVMVNVTSSEAGVTNVSVTV